MLLEEPRLGPYRIIRPIGQGGMATVYEGIDARMDRRVAIKRMAPAPSSFGSPGVTDDPAAMVMRLQREARLLANLTHPNVVMIYDVGVQDGHPYLVMEYLDGVTLQQYLANRNAPLPLVEAAHILDQIASGLDAMHAAGIVHRDLKSSNVMLLERDGLPPRVKLLDLGIARPAMDMTLTSTGVIMGSPSYVAPEILQGQKATEASDLWGLGVLLYEMLSGGHLPFPGVELSTVLYRIAHEPPAPLPGLPARVSAVLAAALSKNPAARPSTAQALAERFRAAMETADNPLRQIEEAGKSFVASLAAPRRRSGALGALATTAALTASAALVSGGWLWWQHAHPSPVGKSVVVAQAAALPPPAAVAEPVLQATPAPVATPAPRHAALPAPRPAPRRTGIATHPAPVTAPKPAPVRVIKVAVVKPLLPAKRTTVRNAAPRERAPRPMVLVKQTPIVAPRPKPVAMAAPVVRRPIRHTPVPALGGRKGHAVQVAMARGRRVGKDASTSFLLTRPLTTGIGGVRRAMNAWIDANQDGELDLVLRWYAPQIERYQRRTDLSIGELRAEKLREYQQGRPEHITVDSPQFSTSADGTRLTVRFRKDFTWVAATGAQSRSVWEEMVWVWTGTSWRILSERDTATLR